MFLDVKPDHVNYLKTIKQLTGYFGIDNVYIGGSYSYSKELDIKWNMKDIDVFILIPRMESWALVNILNMIFDNVHTFEFDFSKDVQKALKNKAEYYKIDNQWKRVVCNSYGIEFDLIFVNNTINDLLKNTGSSISKLYHKITYKDNKMILIPESKTVLKYLIQTKYCLIKREQCTDAYASKIIDLCNKLGYKYGN